MIRICDLCFALLGIILGFPLLLLIALFIYFDTGSPFFVQQRVGKNKTLFNLVKFRTMSLETKSVASHLADPSQITRLGAILRKSKLDELPQLFNVLLGHMSLVGPRPNLQNQLELIEVREKRGVYNVRPGITGLAQINNIDMSEPELLASTDATMIKKMNIHSYFYYILKTITGSGSGDAIS
ncbi:sugar transferase [Alteromonas sp. W364]|uniref:sugar transferase n=1 Tax=Alteromonas sp. W364 TaxID=3075610 RepID=UPI0028862687|nr:sugar transferase [Alteromonas sp. W364]MDT0627744.1 sugar transferase [Alteromonas sp. W364]